MSFKISGPAVGFDSSGKSVVSFDSPRNSILASIEAFVKFCGSVQLKEVTLPLGGSNSPSFMMAQVGEGKRSLTAQMVTRRVSEEKLNQDS